MNVALIEMPAEVAEQELKSYRRALHRRADSEYEEITRGLEALAKGTKLLQLSRVFREVPRDEKGRPRLAIARADRLRVRYSRGWNRSGYDEFDSGYSQRRGTPARDSHIAIATALPEDLPGKSIPQGYAIVPIVPPDVRGTRDLSRHFILWEVERWANQSRDVGPDVDPFLLERVSADLYAVVGEWDLTPLEQAVLGGRRER